jgi:hypothetical protein
MTAPLSDKSFTEESSYRRLPGRGRRTSGCISVGAATSTIWLASDHLLLRESVYGISETYKRFYFRDVQAFIVRRSPRWIAWICVWTILSLLFFFCWGTADWRGWGWPFFSALCFVLTMIQLARGPSCVTYLMTAVQRELLSSLNTVRKARRGLKRLVPLIQEKQGVYDPAMLAEPIQMPRSREAAVAPAVVPGTSVIVRVSRIHFVLFAMTFAGGCIALWETFSSSSGTITATAILLAATIILAVVTLAMQARHRVNKTVAALTWTITLGYIVAWIVIYTVYTTVYSVQQAVQRAPRQKPSQVNVQLTPSTLRQMPGFDYVLLVYGACSATLGAAGLGALFFRRPRVNEPPPLPAKTNADAGA